MIKSICKRYILVSLATMVIIGVASFLLHTYFQIDLGSGGTIVSIIIPALDAGSTYYKKSGETPSTQVRWAFARYFTAIQFVIAILLLTIAWSFIPELSALTSSVGVPIMLAFAAFYLVLIFLVTRYFFGAGIKNAQKIASRVSSQHNKP